MIVRFLAVIAASIAGIAGAARAADALTTPAEYAVIMDYRTGEVLFEKNARTPTAPASMSKLMTVAIVFDRLKEGTLRLDDEFDVSEKAWRRGQDGRESKMWVRVGTSIPVIDLLRGIIVQSGNDACIVVAENISGSEEAFAQLMNQKAREWGMRDSTFANSHGVPHPDQKMSMLDLALLARKIIHDYADYYALFAEREFTWEKIRQSNRNPILETFDGADGLKTGHTEESGFGLVASAVRDGERRIVVVNGLASDRERAVETTRLMRVAFNDFAPKSFFDAGDVVAEAEVFKGRTSNVALTTKEPVRLLLHRSAFDKATATVVYEGPVSAPIRQDQQIGYLRIAVEGGPDREYPLFASAAVKEAGVFGKIGLAAKKLLLKPPSDGGKAQADAE